MHLRVVSPVRARKAPLSLSCRGEKRQDSTSCNTFEDAQQVWGAVAHKYTGEYQATWLAICRGRSFEFARLFRLAFPVALPILLLCRHEKLLCLRQHAFLDSTEIKVHHHS